MNLLERLKSSLDAADNPSGAGSQHAQRIAAAVLLLEMQHADNHAEGAERDEIRSQLKAFFALDDADADELIAAARPRQDESVSLHRFLKVLNEALSVEQKRAVVVMLWRVAYADQQVDAQEEHLLRNITELLYLPHREFIRAKLAVLGE